MKIIALAAAKGGVGKTTLAAALSVAAARSDAVVALADLDPQGSLTRWWNARALPNPLLLRLAPERLPRASAALRGVPLDFLMLDCPPGFSPILERAVAAADLVLVPTGPGELDLAAVASTAEMAERAGAPLRFASIQRPPVLQGFSRAITVAPKTRGPRPPPCLPAAPVMR